MVSRSVVVRDIAEVEVAVDQGLRELEGRQRREPALGPGEGRRTAARSSASRNRSSGLSAAIVRTCVPGRVEAAFGEPGRAQPGQVGDRPDLQVRDGPPP